MKLARLLPAILLLCAATPAQDKVYECKVKKLEVRGGGSQWVIDFTLEHNFPERSIFSAWVLMSKHEYIWKSGEFVFGPETKVPLPLSIAASGKTARPNPAEPLTVPCPGIYQLCFCFDPGIQTADSVRKTMGRGKWYRFDFQPVTVIVGDAKKLFLALQDDTDDCDRMIRKAFETMEKIERDSEDPEYEKKQGTILASINKLKTECEKKIAYSLHAGTYKIIGQILDELEKVCQQIKMMKMMGKVGGNGGNGGTGEEAPTEHQGPDDKPIIPGLDNKILTLDRMKEHITFCDDVRVREYFSWITILHLLSLDRIDEAYGSAKKGEADGAKSFNKARAEAVAMNEELERAFKFMTSSKSEDKFVKFSTYLVEEKEQKYADFFLIVREYVQTVTTDSATPGEPPATVTDQQKKVRDHINAARDKAMGKKPKKQP